MSVQYQVRLYDPTGVQRAVFDSWKSLFFYQKINGFGNHTISIDGRPGYGRELFMLDSIVEILRRDVGITPWTTEYVGFHRTFQDQTTANGEQIFTTFGRGPEDLLRRRTVLYYAGTSYDTKSGFADDVMKALVRENAGASALVSNGRLTDGQTLGLSVVADASIGPTWAGGVAWKNLLDALQTIAQASGVDFNVVRTGGATFEFRTYYPRLGTDRSGSGSAPAAIFSFTHANMAEPYATESHVEEVNDVFALGQGDETNRVWRERRNTAAILQSPWNRIERTHDQRNVTTNASLDADADQQLEALRATRLIAFKAVQSDSSRYGRDYFLGDLVIARYLDAEENKKIVGIEVTMAEGKEAITIHFDDEKSTTLA